MDKCINCEYPGVNGFKTEDEKCTLCGKEFPDKGSKSCEHDAGTLWEEVDVKGRTYASVTKAEYPKCPICPQPKDSEA